MRRASGEPLTIELGTLAELFLDGARAGKSDALRRRLPDGRWERLSTNEVVSRVRRLALGLRDLELEPGDRVGILSHTRLEWTLTDFALVMARLVSVPVYPVLPPDQIRYVLGNAGARVLFVSDQEDLDKVVEILDELPRLEMLVAFDPVTVPRAGGAAGETPSHRPPVVSFHDLLERGTRAEATLGEDYESYALQTLPEDLATLIYTSGTTGEPKGVMLSHSNVQSNARLATEVFPISTDDVALSLLPLAHIFERVVGQYIMWLAGVTVAYAESTLTVARDMSEVRPTVMAAVPRVYEKVLERVEEAAREGGALKVAILAWARRVGEERASCQLEGRRPGAWLALRGAVADRLVFSKLRARTGGRIRYFLSGGAPLSPEIARFFLAAGLPIYEGYGLTETSPILTFNPVDGVRLGSVGRPFPGTEIRIADDGEILARGPQIMLGYHDDPETTRQVIDEDGWFHTGDIGELDPDGYLRITDRKKELIVTAYGKNIAPQPVERAMKADPLVNEAVMLGDRRKFPIALIVPNLELLRARAAELGISAETPEALLSEPRLRDELERSVLSRCSDFARHERPRRVLTVPDQFTVEGGELTPTLKVKRRVIVQRYANEIDELYEMAEREQEAAEAAGADLREELGG